MPTSKARARKDAEPDPGVRERILSSAYELFQESGYEGTSVNRIAKASKVTPAAMYWHFPSKQALLAEMLKRMYEVSYAQLEKAVRSQGPAPERLSDYVRAYIRIQLEDVGERRVHSYSTLASSLDEGDQRELGRLSKPYIALLREILEQGVAEGVFHIDDLATTSYAISTMCEYVFTWFRTGGDLTIEQAGERHLDYALRMVSATRAAGKAAPRKRR